MTLSTVTNHPRNKVRIERTRELAPMWGRVLAIAMVTGFLVGTAKAEVLYVSADALPGGDGQTWSTAHRFLQDALAAAGPGSGVTEIRVAQGVYKPDRSEAAPNGTGDRNASFQLISGVALRGGFAGPGSHDPDARDWEVHETTLSGDLAGNDGPNFENYGDNSYTVVRAVDTTANTIVEGFVIRGGYSNGPAVYPWHGHYGGGMHIVGGMLIVRDCLFHRNLAHHGAGLFAGVETNITLADCRFEFNRAFGGSGGGVYLGTGKHWIDLTVTAALSDCEFINNVADGAGGGVFGGYAAVNITDSRFVNNTSTGGGGAFFHEGLAGSSIVRSEFRNNTTHTGGGLVISKGAPMPITNCRFISNNASFVGGGALVVGGHHLVNCLVVGNESPWGGGIGYTTGAEFTNCTIANNIGYGLEAIEDLPSTPVLVQNSILWGNTLGQLDENALGLVFNSNVQGGWFGAGSNNIDADPLFVQPSMLDYRLGEGSPCIDVGNNFALPPNITTDLAGGPRILNGIVDLGAYEGEYEPLPPIAMASNVPPDLTIYLSPLGGVNFEDPLVAFTNETDAAAEYVIVVQPKENPHPEAGGFEIVSPALDVETSLSQGQYLASIYIPITPEVLSGISPQDLRLVRYNEASGRWVTAVNQNVANQASAPVIEVGPAWLTWTVEKGTHGVYWNPNLQIGVVWSNVDRSGVFSAGVNTCPADITGNGSVGLMDVLQILLYWDTSNYVADLNGDGHVDLMDLLLLLSAWGPCP